MARRSTLRASDADRDGVIDRLREAAGEGRLAAHELEQRIAAALGAQTYGELDATVSDLPSPPSHNNDGRRRRTAAGHAVATVRAHPALLLVAIPIVMIVVAVMIAVTMVWAAVTVLALVLGHRRAMYHRGPPRLGPWRYSSHPARRSGFWT